MNIEYVMERDPKEDRSIVLLHGDDPGAVAALAEAVRSLAAGGVERVAVHQTPGFRSVRGTELSLCLGPTDTGVALVRPPGTFEWSAPAARWTELADFLHPFCSRISANSFQYLEDGITSGIEFMISIKRFGHPMA